MKTLICFFFKFIATDCIYFHQTLAVVSFSDAFFARRAARGAA